MGPEQSNPKPTTFQSKNEKRKVKNSGDYHRPYGVDDRIDGVPRDMTIEVALA
jgi:hypothetical protein